MKIGLDKDIAATLVADLVRSGIHIERGAQVSSFQIPPSNRAAIKVTLEGSKGTPRPRGCVTEVMCDAYLAAVGRKPNTSGLKLQAIGVEVDEYGGIKVDSELQTTCPNVYAAGDVLGRPFLASTGLAQGISAIDSMFLDSSQKVLSCSSVAADTSSDELCVDGNLGSAGASFDPVALAANPFAFPVGVWSSPEAGKMICNECITFGILCIYFFEHQDLYYCRTYSDSILWFINTAGRQIRNSYR